MELSNFVIMSDMIHNGKYRILYSSLTSKIYLLNNKICNKLLNSNFAGIEHNNIDFLYKEGLIVNSRDEEFESFKKSIYFNLKNRKSLYIVILPTADCQFNCTYCGQTHKNLYMSEDQIKNIIKRIEFKLLSNNIQHLSVGWFGGEPVLAIKQIELFTSKLMSRIKDKGISYQSSIVTNGLNLSLPIFKRLVEMNITKFEITLDGDANIHNQRRNINSSCNAYNIIINNLFNIINSNYFQKQDIKFIIRCNVDKTNKYAWIGLINRLCELQILDKISSLYLAPIHSWGNNAHKTAMPIAEFADIELQFVSELIARGYKIKHIPSHKQRTCIATSLYDEVIDVHGNTHNCTEIPLVEKYDNIEQV